MSENKTLRIRRYPINVLVGRNITRIREQRGISAIDAAFRCEIDKADLWRIEAGLINITLYTMGKIVSGLEVDVTELFQGYFALYQ